MQRGRGWSGVFFPLCWTEALGQDPHFVRLKAEGPRFGGNMLTTLILALPEPWEPHEGGSFPLKGLD